MRLSLGAIVVVALAFFAKPERATLHTHPLLLDDAEILTELEDRGLSFDRVVGRGRRVQIARAVADDMIELTKGHASDDPRRPFHPEWISRGHFELVGVVHRIDRRRFDAEGCGEVRLVYRLALKNRRRPETRLPMTVNVRIPQPTPRGERDCKSVAARWLAREDVLSIVEPLLPPAQIEINFQSTHAPGARRDMDDSAEYVLRSFEVEGSSVRVDGLFNTPRADLNKADLVTWIAQNLDAIDDGRAVLPKSWLATRAVSVSPRGLVHAQNRPFSSIVSTSDLEGRIDAKAIAALKVAKTPALVLRRLDESTCTGCHQSRSVAGFHLLGEERSPASFNQLAVGHSPHLGADLAWRAGDLASAARGELGAARPFATYPNGELGSDCGRTPGLATWTCEPGLVCRDVHHADVGICARATAVLPGDPCEDIASMSASDRGEGPIVLARTPDATCPAPVGEQREGPFCAPNWLGFTGGLCSERCSVVGERRGDAICAPLPAAGYEADCFLSREPIESCLERHLVTAYVASCDAHRACRGDYGCARVPGAPSGVGACVPPYFIFQARVDGPRLDR